MGAFNFHKRLPGLYGTSLFHDVSNRWEYLHCPECHDEHEETGAPIMVETCIDRYTCGDGWNVRYVCKHDDFTDTLGEWFPTLRDGKEYFRTQEVK